MHCNGDHQKDEQCIFDDGTREYNEDCDGNFYCMTELDRPHWHNHISKFTGNDDYVCCDNFPHTRD